ncbi:MAG: murein L,D-transpeptidase catalytic domain family protein [Deltaproteobacteria bacterium]|nr:murein L,D-transpeptidase catalytic domain family protein [Deltaproteobacteria bacterium]
MTVDGVVGKGTAARLAGVSAAAKKKPEASEDRARKQDKGAPDIAVSAGQFEGEGLQRAVLSVALDVFVNGWKAGKTTKMIYTIIDFSMPSTEKRLFILNLEAGTLIRKELVTHGGKSGGNQPTKFSNREGSNQSSIGLARTGGTYEGKHGTSLYLEGLEEGYNSNMKDRHVVMHAADYATPEAIKANGGTRLGRSEGCPAMDPRVAGDVIDTVKNGTLVFSYYPDPKYLEQSEYVNG